MNAAILKSLKKESEALGFHNFGVAKVPMELRRDYYNQWIKEGKHGTMAWMENNNERRLNPESLMPEAKSILVFAMNYYQKDPERNFRVAKYALGKDYHSVIYKRLKKICRFLKENYHSDQKPYVDTGPVLEKPIAEAAGLGWQGKSTILVEKKRGTWSFLGSIVTTLDLPASKGGKDYCGNCTRCIDCCPTQAITSPYKLDASKCISYLTIEHKGSIPHEYREAVGDRVFGCDECLDVCPWNKWAKITNETQFAVRSLPDLKTILAWGEEDFKSNLVASPIKRVKLNGLKRNVALVLGNIGSKDDLPALESLANSNDIVLQEQAEWSIKAIKSRECTSFS
ncbi:MAG: Epoxyqueuosine reductase [Puniceicoccaceae bacterium MED-G32]|jgi:epoxyqueuosine reductase|nr:MAG: Epoxyqueuosine reductase [Puniceicoccaceae bacterium MED-G32]